MKKRVSLKNLFERGTLCLEFGGTIFHGESDNDYDLINDTTQEVIIRNDEQLEFGEWCHDETDGKFIVGTSDSGEKVYFSKEEYERAVSEKRTIELDKEYLFAGYRWVPVEINENYHVAVMQSLGVTAGPWPGFSMENLGNGNHYTHNIDEYDISKYDDKTYALMKQIKSLLVSLMVCTYRVLKILMATSYGKMLLREQRVTTVRSARPTATRGPVITAAAATRGSSAWSAAPTTTIRAIRMLSLSLLISIYLKLRLWGIKLSLEMVKKHRHHRLLKLR